MSFFMKQKRSGDQVHEDSRNRADLLSLIADHDRLIFCRCVKQFGRSIVVANLLEDSVSGSAFLGSKGSISRIRHYDPRGINAEKERFATGGLWPVPVVSENYVCRVAGCGLVDRRPALPPGCGTEL